MSVCPSDVAEPPEPTGITLRDPVVCFIENNVVPQLEQVNAHDEIHRTSTLLWRSARSRKVTPKKVSAGHILFLYSGRAIGSFDRSTTTLASHLAVQVCDNRSVLRSYLSASSVPNPASRVLRTGELSVAKESLTGSHLPLIVESNFRGVWRGAIGPVSTAAQLSEAWAEFSRTSAAGPQSRVALSLSKYTPGLGLRVYVIGENVVGALVRVPFFIVGNGQDSVEFLVDDMRIRLGGGTNPRLPTDQSIESFLSWVGRSKHDIPNSEEVVVLQDVQGSASRGAVLVEVMDGLSPDLANLAIDAVWALPGLSAAGVDISTTSLHSAADALVQDVNPGADLAEYRYPTLGHRNRIGLRVIDHMIKRAR